MIREEKGNLLDFQGDALVNPVNCVGTMGKGLALQFARAWPGMVSGYQWDCDRTDWSCPVIGVELTDDATPLDRFTHPERALYLLGAEDHGLPPAVLGRCHHVVAIPAVRPESLNVAVAGSIIIWDRYSTLKKGPHKRDCH